MKSLIIKILLLFYCNLICCFNFNINRNNEILFYIKNNYKFNISIIYDDRKEGVFMVSLK